MSCIGCRGVHDAGRLVHNGLYERLAEERPLHEVRLADEVLELERRGVFGRGQLHHYLLPGSGFRVQGAGCRVEGAGCRVEGAGLRVEGSGATVALALHVLAELARVLGRHHVLLNPVGRPP